MKKINWSDFEKIEIRVGTIIYMQDFPKALKPAYKIWVDFGVGVGIKKTSAQITNLYSKEHLIGKQVIGVINLEPKQIAEFKSEFLLTGINNGLGEIVIITPEQKVPNGAMLF
ncbi:MAG: tRNA-binding protein [Bacteroidetes bacterium]|nr:tRNA-binding protein [Bacteroidota bacterium]